MAQHRTRSGRVFRGILKQSSPWAEASEVLQILLDHLDWDSLLKARLVCQAWRSSFSTPVKELQLQQPASVREGQALGRKAAAAFSSATALHLTLLQVQEPAVDLTADDGDEPAELHGPASLWHPAAGAALLRQLSKGKYGRLQQLEVIADADLTYPFLPVLLKAALQLQVLDLSRCRHDSADLLVLAQHAGGLQELLLHCQAFTTLSGRRIRHGNLEWCRQGGNTAYQPQHIAALAALPQLQQLEIPLPIEQRRGAQGVADWFDAVACLTSLTSLHVVQHGVHFEMRPRTAAVAALSRLTQLRHLRCHAGNPWSVEESDAPDGDEGQLGSDRVGQAGCWSRVLPCLPHLSRLELLSACVDDALLHAVGSNAQCLQHLVLDSSMEFPGSRTCSKAGADAVAHVQHIELVFSKGFECPRKVELLQLPAVKQVFYRKQACCPWGSQVESAPWKQDTCPCAHCYRVAHNAGA